jgi:hypothetical protein
VQVFRYSDKLHAGHEVIVLGRIRTSYLPLRKTKELYAIEGGATKMSNYKQQLQKMKTHPGFIAALDQSGGSTPKALSLYGIKEDAWSNEDEMFAIVHQMRTRIITSPSFTGERILAAILFENTMDRDIEGQPTADYLWNVKRVVPFLKVDKGLAAEKSGVQLMKAMPELPALLDRAKAKRIFGTKMRSLIKQANAAGINDIVAQQFEAAHIPGNWATRWRIEGKNGAIAILGLRSSTLRARMHKLGIVRPKPKAAD